MWFIGELRILFILIREKLWININGLFCGRGRGGGSIKRVRESIIVYKIIKR